MDCSVVQSKKYPDMCVVSTTDFFFPNVEDPYEQGRLACCNVLSDMYAMGLYEVDNVLMLIAASLDMSESDRNICTKLMIKGFDDTCKLAGTNVTGGQTTYNPWPIIGGVAKSVVKRADIIMPTGAVAGDVLVLTKPLGTQVAVNLRQWMGRGETKWNAVEPTISKAEAMTAFYAAQRQMTRLNRNAARLMHAYGAHAATDVTGFGLLGHARNLASNQVADVSFTIHTLPCIANTPKVNDKVWSFKLTIGLSAETSGGLLVALPREQAEAYVKELSALDGAPAWIIGDVVAGGGRTAALIEKPKIIDV